MKLLTTLFFLTSISIFALNAAAQSETKITKLTLDEHNRTVRMEPGFDDSSFYYQNPEETQKIVFCYSGVPSQVCDVLKAFEAQKMDDYTGGDHDYIELLSCAPQGKSVFAEYNLVDDYNTKYKVQKEIINCTTQILSER